MLKKLMVFLITVFFIVPTIAQARSIDVAYYEGWVATDGGTTINDGYWIWTNEYGHEYPSFVPGWNGYFEDDTYGELHIIRQLDNGALAKIHWSYNEDPPISDWVPRDAELYRVNGNTGIFYGFHDFKDNQTYLFDRPIRFPRKWEEGRSYSFTGTIGPFELTQTYTFVRSGLTLSGIAVPGGSDLTDCALIHMEKEYPDHVSLDTRYWAPGKGTVLAFSYDNNNGSQIETDVRDKVNDWGVGGYPGSISSYLTTALTVLNGITLSDDNPIDVRQTGGNRVVVIPLGN